MINLKKYIKAVLFSKHKAFQDFNYAMGYKNNAWFMTDALYKVKHDLMFSREKIVKMACVLDIPVSRLDSAMHGDFQMPDNFIEGHERQIKSRWDLYYFVSELCYFHGFSPAEWSESHGLQSGYLRDKLKRGKEKHIAMFLEDFLKPLHVSVKPLIPIINELPSPFRTRYIHPFTQRQTRIFGYLRSYMFLRGSSLEKLGKQIGHSKEWILSRLFKSTTVSMSAKKEVLHDLSHVLKIPYSDFEFIINGNTAPMISLQYRMELRVHDRRSLLDLFMVASYLHGYHLHDVSTKFGHRGKYVGHAIKKRSVQTLLKKLPPIAEFLDIPDLPSLLRQAHIFVAKAKGMNGHDPYTSLTRSERKLIGKTVLSLVMKHRLTYRQLDKSLPYFSISSEIHKGSRRGIVETLGWLTAKLDEDPKYFAWLLSQVGMSSYQGVYKQDIKRFKGDPKKSKK